MTQRSNNVLPKNGRSKEDVSAALGDAWHRISRQVGKGRLADTTGAKCTKTIDNAIAGHSLPELHTALNSLLACNTALDEVFALYGGRFVPFVSQAANDYAVISGLNHAIGSWVHALEDYKRDHRETLALAELLRPLVASLSSIIEEADELKKRRA